MEGKTKGNKNLYGDRANTFRMLFNFKAEVEKRSPGSVVEIDTEVSEAGDVEWPVGSLQCSRWTQLDVPCCCWLVSVEDRGFMDMVRDAVEKMLQASVTFGSPHRCM